MIYYAGIGSRETPQNILEEMEDLGEWFGIMGFCLRSGAAPGADSAFEAGADKVKGLRELFLPWDNFQQRYNWVCNIPLDAYTLAEEIHPNWKALGNGAKRLVARNMQQILGQNLNVPSSFVVCWTSDGCESHETYSRKTGGTGSAIALASKRNIPVFNLKNEGRLKQLEHFVSDLYNRMVIDPTHEEE